MTFLDFRKRKNILSRFNQSKANDPTSHRGDLHISDTYTQLGSDSAELFLAYATHLGVPSLYDINQCVKNAGLETSQDTMRVRQDHGVVQLIAWIPKERRPIEDVFTPSMVPIVVNASYKDIKTGAIWNVKESAETNDRFLIRAAEDDISKILEHRRQRMSFSPSRVQAALITAGYATANTGDVVKFYHNNKVYQRGTIKSSSPNTMTIESGGETIEIPRESIISVVDQSPQTEEKKDKLRKDYYKRAYGFSDEQLNQFTKMAAVPDAAAIEASAYITYGDLRSNMRQISRKLYPKVTGEERRSIKAFAATMEEWPTNMNPDPASFTLIKASFGKLKEINISDDIVDERGKIPYILSSLTSILADTMSGTEPGTTESTDGDPARPGRKDKEKEVGGQQNAEDGDPAVDVVKDGAKDPGDPRLDQIKGGERTKGDPMLDVIKSANLDNIDSADHHAATDKIQSQIDALKSTLDKLDDDEKQKEVQNKIDRLENLLKGQAKALEKKAAMILGDTVVPGPTVRSRLRSQKGNTVPRRQSRGKSGSGGDVQAPPNVKQRLYEHYTKQVKKAGRTPMSFSDWQRKQRERGSQSNEVVPGPTAQSRLKNAKPMSKRAPRYTKTRAETEDMRPFDVSVSTTVEAASGMNVVGLQLRQTKGEFYLDVSYQDSKGKKSKTSYSFQDRRNVRGLLDRYKKHVPAKMRAAIRAVLDVKETKQDTGSKRTNKQHISLLNKSQALQKRLAKDWVGKKLVVGGFPFDVSVSTQVQADAHDERELELYMENDAGINRGVEVIVKKLEQAGKLREKDAWRALFKFVQKAARQYMNEFRGTDHDYRFNNTSMENVAKSLLEGIITEMDVRSKHYSSANMVKAGTEIIRDPWYAEELATFITNGDHRWFVDIKRKAKTAKSWKDIVSLVQKAGKQYADDLYASMLEGGGDPDPISFDPRIVSNAAKILWQKLGKSSGHLGPVKTETSRMRGKNVRIGPGRR